MLREIAGDYRSDDGSNDSRILFQDRGVST